MQPAPFIPESAPFNFNQRLWLNGYMAGLLAGKNFIPASNADVAAGASPAVPLLILFGSQTGTAEKLAREIAQESKAHGCNARVVDAAQHATIDWSQESNLFIVTSTYGDGEMPDNAQGFWDWLQTSNASTLAHLNFSVLALGDTNYEQFCAAGKKMDARLEQLGAKRLHPLAACDLDYEAKVKSWTQGALAALAPENLKSEKSAALPESASLQTVGTFSKSNPFPARLLTNRRLNGEGSEKETRHFEISLAGSGLSYEAGDALGVWPVNCPQLVDEILSALNFNGEETTRISERELTLRQALLEQFDISKPSAELLQHFAQGNEKLRDLLVPEKKDDLKKWLWGREIVDLLLEFRGAKLTPPEFVALLKKMAPRLYSISSSPQAHAGQVHLTINVVRHESHGRVRKGVGSTFLADRAGETAVPIFVHAAPGFRLPTDGNRPVIMIGPGTGVAPFRAFLHERRAAGAKGHNWLFFGEQHAARDFYYRDELEQMFSDGHLTKLSTAFSRDQAEKIYVQHRMLEHAAEFWSWLQNGAHLYVCGDAARMAKDVDLALHKIVETAGGMDEAAAKAYVAKLKSEKRYQRDVY